MLKVNEISKRYYRSLSKSLAHAQIQHHLKKQIDGLELEKTVGKRRADAAWEAYKIVFEIQISPLSLEEAQRRCHDYETAGYQVVWILHDQLYNQHKLSAVEAHLRTFYTTYFTDGAVVYDQWDVTQGSIRKYQERKLPVDLSKPFVPFLKLPSRVWKLHFLGDLHTWCGLNGTSHLKKTIHKYGDTRSFHRWLKWLGFRLLEWVSSDSSK